MCNKELSAFIKNFDFDIFKPDCIAMVLECESSVRGSLAGRVLIEVGLVYDFTID
jgi:hypothetical protein